MFQQRSQRGPLSVAVVACLVAVAACGTDDETGSSATSSNGATSAPTTAAPATSIAPSTSGAGAAPIDFSERGPFAVGVSTEILADGRPVLTFYPADRTDVPVDATPFAYTAVDMWNDPREVWPIGWSMEVPDAWTGIAASSEGPFPLVVFSHGWGNTRFSHSLHAAHLASWGFVVAVPEHVSRDILARLAGQTMLPPNDVATVVATIELMAMEAARPGGLLQHQVATDQVSVEGYSAGGRDAALAAQLPVVDAFITVAGTPPVPDDGVADGELFAPATDLEQYLASIPPPDKPSLLVVSGDDGVVAPGYSESVFDWLVAPKRLVVIGDTGHVAYMDGCGRYQRGELPGLVATFGLDPASVTVQIAENGCAADQAPAADVAMVWNHVAVAQLRWVFGIDADVALASLDGQWLDERFPGLVERSVAVG